MAAIEYESTLLTTKPFIYLTTDELDIIKGYCKILEFKKEDLLFEQGKRNEGMYIILKGNALVIAKMLGKNIINLATLEEGNFFGEVSLIQKASCAATVIANTDLLCLQLTTNYFDMLTLSYPEIKYKITKAITEEVCDRLRNSYTSIKETIKKTDMSKEPFPVKQETKINQPRIALTTFPAVRLEKYDLLKYLFFKLYDKNELDILIAHAGLLNVPKDFLLIKEGEEHPAFYIVLRGAIQFSIMHKNKKAKLAVISPISICGSMSFIIKSPSTINCTTCERAILLKISDTKLIEIENNHPVLWYKLYSAISESFIALERAADKLMIRLNSELYNR